jgi:excisionase family DNA binding protein
MIRANQRSGNSTAPSRTDHINAAPMNLPMMKLSEVASRLNCSLSNVYSLVQGGRLSVISTGATGKGFRVTEEELLRFIEEGRRGSRPSPPPIRSKPITLKHLRL